jgi:hypothetical protein
LFCYSAEPGRFRAVFGTEKVSKTRIEISCLSCHRIWKSLERGNLHPFGSEGFKRGEDGFEGQMVGNSWNDIINGTPFRKKKFKKRSAIAGDGFDREPRNSFKMIFILIDHRDPGPGIFFEKL